MKKRIKREKRKEHMQIPKKGGQKGKARGGLEGGRERKHTGNKKGEDGEGKTKVWGGWKQTGLGSSPASTLIH